MSADGVLVRTDFGRWVHDDFLQAVRYYPKGKRRATISLPLRMQDNTAEGALRAIVLALSPRRGRG